MEEEDIISRQGVLDSPCTPVKNGSDVCFAMKFALPPFSPPLPSGVQYRAEAIYLVKGSVSFVLKFALPPFSPPLQYKFQNKTRPEPLIK